MLLNEAHALVASIPHCTTTNTMLNNTMLNNHYLVEIYTFYNEKGAAMAAGCIHPEKERFHGRKLDAYNVVVSSTGRRFSTMESVCILT